MMLYQLHESLVLEQVILLSLTAHHGIIINFCILILEIVLHIIENTVFMLYTLRVLYQTMTKS